MDGRWDRGIGGDGDEDLRVESTSKEFGAVDRSCLGGISSRERKWERV